MLYIHAVRGADAGAKINNPRGEVRTRQNIPKPHRVRAVRGAVDISSTVLVALLPFKLYVTHEVFWWLSIFITQKLG